MAYTTFPAYAQFLTDGYTAKSSSALERTEMADGYIEQAPRNTRGRTERAVTYRLASLADREAFEAWRLQDLHDGALFFGWPVPDDPTGATVRRARIVSGEVTYSALTNRLDDFTVSLTVEYWS